MLVPLEAALERNGAGALYLLPRPRMSTAPLERLFSRKLAMGILTRAAESAT